MAKNNLAGWGRRLGFRSSSVPPRSIVLGSLQALPTLRTIESVILTYWEGTGNTSHVEVYVVETVIVEEQMPKGHKDNIFAAQTSVV